jgi:hypothetical protein
MSPNFTLLDMTRAEIATLVAAMVQAREAVGRRSLSHPQEPTSEEWWGDVLADPRARRREQRASDLPLRRAFYTLADEKRDTVLVACGKCDWKAAFQRDELVVSHGRDYPIAESARTPRQAGVREDRIAVGPLRRVLRRADRGRHATLISDWRTVALGKASGVYVVSAGIGRMSALGANLTRRVGGSDVSDPTWTSARTPPAYPARFRTIQVCPKDRRGPRGYARFGKRRSSRRVHGQTERS